ncbi:MAG TPA: 6-bladed beta-propeller [Candidatus Acidoferrales bacterium]|nr:6-bladed beta-propeller [Candidatus Acidoferrales bacterium]
MLGNPPIRQLRCLPAAWLLWLSGLLACGSQPAIAPAWPPPPAQPCIVYVRDIAAPKDIGAKAPFFTRLANRLTGVTADSRSLSRPFGLSLDAAGNLLVTDTGANAVCYLDLAHKKWLRWTAAGDRRFVSPVAAVHQGRIFYVADSGLGAVVALDEKGRRLFEITNELARPSGLALLGGHLLVVDAELHQVVVFGLQGELISKFGRRGNGPGEFNFPTHIAVDDRNQIYVTDSLNFRIQVFSADGLFLRAFGSAGDGPGHFSRPKGVAIDRSGHVYVVDAMFGNVQIFDDQGRLLLDFGQDGSAPGELSLPNAIAINSNNEIYVADAYNHRLQMFRYTGKE